MNEYSVYVMITRALNDRNKCTTADLAEAEGGNPAAAMEVSLMRLNEVLEDDDFSEEDMPGGAALPARTLERWREA